jgi:hypothetical protein
VPLSKRHATTAVATNPLSTLASAAGLLSDQREVNDVEVSRRLPWQTQPHPQHVLCSCATLWPTRVLHDSVSCTRLADERGQRVHVGMVCKVTVNWPPPRRLVSEDARAAQCRATCASASAHPAAVPWAHATHRLWRGQRNAQGRLDQPRPGVRPGGELLIQE